MRFTYERNEKGAFVISDGTEWLSTCPKEMAEGNVGLIVDKLNEVLVCEHTFDEAVKFVAAHLRQQGKTYIEIAVDPKTNRVAHSFTATLMQGTS